MALRFRKKSKKAEIERARRRRMDVGSKGKGRLLAADKFAGMAIYLFLCLSIIAICFVGQSPSSPVLLGQNEAKIQVVANFPFSYESSVLTKRKREDIARQIGPSYRIEMEGYRAFVEQLDAFRTDLDDLQKAIEPLSGEERRQAITRFTVEQPSAVALGVSPGTVEDLLEDTTPEGRAGLFQEAQLALREILQEGVYNPQELSPVEEAGSSLLFQLDIANRPQNARPGTEEEAWRLLRFNIETLEAQKSVRRALFSIFKRGLSPNLRFDPETTQLRIERARENIQPETVRVQQGEVIIEAGTRPSELQREMYRVYRQKLQEREQDELGWSPDLARRAVLTFAVMAAAFLYVQVSLPQLARSRRRIALFTVVLLANLLIMRLVLQLGETEIIETDTALIGVLRHALPVAVGPIILAMMIGSAPAVLMSLLLAVLNALMQGGMFDTLIISFFAGLVAIYFSLEVRTRAKLLRAGAMSGLAAALGVGFLGLFADFNPLLVSQQMLGATITGVLSGVVVVGLLPLLENSFKYITDITLLELTDYNHPLLRRMQMVAPGTYHHSLMVANLSERAAQEIGCNPLVCRAACLFHDIGKMVKPEYFIENQRSGYNPHMEKNPSMSALIIKSHVKEGVTMARQAKLPLVVIDIIRQHHGTTLINYFYHKAQQQAAQARLPLSEGQGTNEEAIDEAAFRYDGPRPRFKESGIIFFADAVEAASRSLKKVTPLSVEELIEGIFKERIDDHQLDDCPLTTQDLKKIRKSFAFTLLNMMHNRIEYPGRTNGKKSESGTRNPLPFQNQEKSITPDE